ncbi:flavodoxin domain-containing protein [Bacillus sp. 03113]|uniref:flavodoxin domain-containing protein n=1 Tax=Bacillus sp. 03113 TaxID=2578211 RepID=UPI0011430755|nr:flavodoxin domain-containing protein [Bacillus sp. 03113]
MKTIIIYATKYGSVEKAAQILKSKMGGRVDLFNIMKESIPSLEKYDRVILGGSIYVGKIQKKLSNYTVKNLSTLLTKNIGLFICAGEKDSDVREKELIEAYPDELYQHATTKEIFGFEINYEKLNFLEKLVMRSKGVKKSVSKIAEDKIEVFAKKMSVN